MFSSVDSARPETEQYHEFAAPDLELDVAQGVYVDVAGAVYLGQTAVDEDRVGNGGRGGGFHRGAGAWTGARAVPQ